MYRMESRHEEKSSVLSHIMCPFFFRQLDLAVIIHYDQDETIVFERGLAWTFKEARPKKIFARHLNWN